MFFSPPNACWYRRLAAGMVFSLSGPLSFAGTVSHHSFESETLGRALSYNVYLPDGYGESQQNFPVLYLLHGASGNEYSWLRAGDLERTADQLIAEERVPPQLIVMPADPNYWWADSHLEAAQSA